VLNLLFSEKPLPAVLCLLGALVSGIGFEPAAGGEERSLRLVTRSSYLPGVPVLIRVEVRNGDGVFARDLWDALATLEATLEPDGTPINLDPGEVVLRNGMGSVLVNLPPGGQAIRITAALGELRESRTLTSLQDQPLLEVKEDLAGELTVWNGLVRVTGSISVPAGSVLRVQPGTLILVDGVEENEGGNSILVEGALELLGSPEDPITITASDPDLPWGEIHHRNGGDSLYRHAIVTRAGNSPPQGHTGTGPAIQATNSKIVFQSCSVGYTRGKTMWASGSDLEFTDCLLARSVMGPEITQTALIFEDSHIQEMYGPDDNDGIYLRDQKAGQVIALRRSVFASCDDDGIDTLNPDSTIEDCILRDVQDKGISITGGETDIRGCLFVNNLIGIALKGSGAVARIDRTTFVGYEEPAEQTGLLIRVQNGQIIAQNSIIRGPHPAAADSPDFLENIQITYSDISIPWVGAGNLVDDPLFVDATNHDFRLQAGSPCIDSGDPGSPLDPDGTRADMGVFYYPHSAQPGFIRGHVNEDEFLDISDPLALLFHLFSGRLLSCRKAADADDGGELGLEDVIYLLDYLFRNGPAPGPPAGSCGPDPTEDSLDSESPACP